MEKSLSKPPKIITHTQTQNVSNIQPVLNCTYARCGKQVTALSPSRFSAPDDHSRLRSHRHGKSSGVSSFPLPSGQFMCVYRQRFGCAVMARSSGRVLECSKLVRIGSRGKPSESPLPANPSPREVVSWKVCSSPPGNYCLGCYRQAIQETTSQPGEVGTSVRCLQSRDCFESLVTRDWVGPAPPTSPPPPSVGSSGFDRGWFPLFFVIFWGPKLK